MKPSREYLEFKAAEGIWEATWGSRLAVDMVEI